MADFLIPLALHNDPAAIRSRRLEPLWESSHPESVSIQTDRRRSCFSQPSSLLLQGYHNHTHRRQISLPSLRSSAMSVSSPPIPSSAAEWKATINEVKQKYLARKYRSCSMQCTEILDGLRVGSGNDNDYNHDSQHYNHFNGRRPSVEPLHLIYLHFYAASSFECCAQSLSSSSTYRTELLRRAQGHYGSAESQIIAMVESGLMARRSRSPSPADSTASSNFNCDPPGLSFSSRMSFLSDKSSVASSPRTSVFSFDDDSPTLPISQPMWPTVVRDAKPKKKNKKKVSFSGLPEFFEFQPEPYVRPDSPTLGWDDDNDTLPSQREIISSFPMSPKTTLRLTSIMKLPQEEKRKPKATIDGERRDESNNTHRRSQTFDLESFLQTRALNRLRGQLSALRDQICRHRAAVDHLLAETYKPISHNTPDTDARPIWAENGSFSPLTSPAWRKCHSITSSLDPSPILAPQATNNNSSGSVPPTRRRPVLHLQTDMSKSRNDNIRPYSIINSHQVHHHHLRRSSSSVSSTSPYYYHTHHHHHDASNHSTPVSITSPPLTAPLLSATSANGEKKEEGIRDRIERLRASGWRRKRFDSRRYEALRGQVLEELGPSFS